MEADAPSYKRIVEQFAYWGGIDTKIHGKTINSQGHGFCGMSRLKLLNIFHDRCDELGVKLRFNTDITEIDQLHMDEYDLVVAGDGLTSLLREAYQDEFGTSVDWRANKFCWLATSKPLKDFTFSFRKEPAWVVVGTCLSLRGGYDHLDSRDQRTDLGVCRHGYGDRGTNEGVLRRRLPGRPGRSSTYHQSFCMAHIPRNQK